MVIWGQGYRIISRISTQISQMPFALLFAISEITALLKYTTVSDAFA